MGCEKVGISGRSCSLMDFLRYLRYLPVEPVQLLRHLHFHLGIVHELDSEQPISTDQSLPIIKCILSIP